jgi:hypothetical protein
MRLTHILLISGCLILLSSCKFSCSVGNNDDAPSTAEFRDGARISNEIELQADGVKVDKAYLLFKDGTAVPAGNIVDFKQPVQLILVIDKGWNETEGRVSLGAYEKIEVETGEVLVEEEDMFAQYTERGISAAAAKRITLTATITLKKEIAPLTTFYVTFKVWDKKSRAFLQGRYKLYSK